MTIFVNSFEKNVFGNFLTFNWQFSGGSGEDYSLSVVDKTLDLMQALGEPAALLEVDDRFHAGLVVADLHSAALTGETTINNSFLL